jgi:hypothetical protein
LTCRAPMFPGTGNVVPQYGHVQESFDWLVHHSRQGFYIWMYMGDQNNLKSFRKQRFYKASHLIKHGSRFLSSRHLAINALIFSPSTSFSPSKSVSLCS